MTDNPYSLSSDIAASQAPPLAPPAAGAATVRVYCPLCNREIHNPGQGLAHCGFCNWRGQSFIFTPLPLTVEHSEQALREDATCIHHSTKRAVAVCAGTGDYICALCAVELNGETYSAEYLSTAGKDLASRAFDRYLDRPDNTIILLIVLCIIPGVCYVSIPGAIFWIPYAWYLYSKALKLRKANPLYARVFGPVRVVAIPICLGLFALAWIATVIWIAYALTHKGF